MNSIKLSPKHVLFLIKVDTNIYFILEYCSKEHHSFLLFDLRETCLLHSDSMCTYFETHSLELRIYLHFLRWPGVASPTGCIEVPCGTYLIARGQKAFISSKVSLFKSLIREQHLSTNTSRHKTSILQKPLTTKHSSSHTFLHRHESRQDNHDPPDQSIWYEVCSIVCAVE